MADTPLSGALRSFDLPSDVYADDVRDIVGCFGPEEWRLVVLTNEIHGHLGIYSTLGAKMGLRAREEFASRGLLGHISIVSDAGSIPPLSCLNDGLQVSTGATVGHGLFALSGAEPGAPTARFSCEGVSFTLSLKDSFRQQIEEDIRTGTSRFGRSEQYWLYVRSLAIRYWSQWDRGCIFDLR